MQTVNVNVARDPHVQLRRLYICLLEDQARFDEFKQLLALYVPAVEGEEETTEANEVRSTLNLKVREWVGSDFEGLSSAQAMLWRSIVVEERINVALSPWKESNWY